MGRIKVRADGDRNTGLGHLVRSKALADMLKEDFSVEFFCRLIPQQLMDEFRQSGLRVHLITEEQDYFNSLSTGDIAIVDGYKFDINYQKKVKQTGATLICIDDMAEGEFVADLIINQSHGVRESDYNALPETKFALGPDYALLRSSFFRDDAHFSKPKFRKNLLICFGGSDVQNISEKALKLVLDFKEFNKITIITGSTYVHEDTLASILCKCKICDYYHAIDEQKMAELMTKSDVAIVPASGILFEALATKNIVISGMYIENQKKNYNALKKLNAFIDAGRFTASEMKAALEKIKSFNPADLIDGKSPDRLRQLFKKLSLQN